MILFMYFRVINSGFRIKNWNFVSRNNIVSREIDKPYLVVGDVLLVPVHLEMEKQILGFVWFST